MSFNAMRFAAITVAAFLSVSASAGAFSLQLPGCPVAPNSAAFPTAAVLRAQNTFLGSLGVRPTGSSAQAKYIRWIQGQLRAIPGVRIGQTNYSIHRWQSGKRVRLTLFVNGKPTTLPVADAIPYSAPTTRRGVAAPVVSIPDSEAITAANARGRIVVREADAGSVPTADFLLPVVSWEEYDPGHTINPLSTFYGDFIAYNDRVADLRAAEAAGAKGILFLKNLPRRQLIGHYEPYEGTAWTVPGMFLGSDQAKTITDALATGTRVSARITDTATFKRVTTPSVLATIPGLGPARVIIDSHTDGTNAVEDNGPIAMVAMARYFAGLPITCRPRTIEFTFTTAHFYQRVGPNRAIRDGGAEQFAEQLDRDYDQGTVSSVLTIEHLGALDYEAVPRNRGPGEVLEPNGLRAIQFIGVTPSPSLVAAVDSVVREYDMRRTILLQGSDAPGPTDPAHCSFGGEGTPYERHLLPTVGVISAPQTLYDPAFGVQGIDFNVMRSELLGYTELVNRLETMSQVAVAGSIPVERAERAAGAAGCPPEN